MIDYFLWTLGAFCGGFLTNNFVEWMVHRFVMHKPFNEYAYRHVTTHHTAFRADETYHADLGDAEKIEKGTSFTWREYLLFPLLCFFLYGAVDLAVGKPILPGALLSVLVNLMMFDILHYNYHVPRDSWFQRTWFFRFMKEHHRLHHADMRKNFNVSFFPIADVVMGTLKR